MDMIRHWRLLRLFSLALLLASCAGLPTYRVVGELAGQEIRTTVDSELAAYYLENFLPGNRTNPRFDSLIASTLEKWERLPLNSDTLRSLSEHSSPDFATLYFITRLDQEPGNWQAYQAFQTQLAALRAGWGNTPPPAARRPTSPLFAFVPGYAYKRDPATGADFGRQRRLLTMAGFRTLLIETEELGTVEQNAAIIAGELRRLGNESVILVSTSKGGAEAALALGKLLSPEQAKLVKAWVSVGGLLRGTPLADRALLWPRRWWTKALLFFHGHPPQILENLSTPLRKEVFASLTFPAHLLMIQIVGVPLSGQVSPDVRERYEILRKLGPNDGLTLLPDEFVPGGVVIADVGLDHYFRDPEIDLKSLALALTVLDLLGKKERGH